MPGRMCGAWVCAAVLIITEDLLIIAEDHCGAALSLSWLFILSVPLSLVPSVHPSLV